MRHFLKAKHTEGEIHLAPGDGADYVLTNTKPVFVVCTGADSCPICRALRLGLPDTITHRMVGGSAIPPGFGDATKAAPVRKRMKAVPIEPVEVI